MTAMITDGNEVSLGIRWILDRLLTDTEAGGLRAPGAYLVGTATSPGIYEGQAPQGAGLPYVEVAYLAGDVVAATVTPEEVMAALRYQVKAIVAGVNAVPAVPIVRRIHARLHNQGGSYTTGTSRGEVLNCQRIAPISYPETPEGAPAVRHHGNEYRLLVQSTS